MKNIITQEIASPKPSALKNRGTVLRDKSTIPLEARTDLTISEVEALGITEPYELIDGRIIFKMAYAKHGTFLSEITIDLGIYLRQHPIGTLITDITLSLSPDDEQNLRRPDLAFYLNENAPTADEPATRAPDLAVEIFTSDSGFLTLLDKADLYLSKGSKVVWIVIPAKASVLVWKAIERRWEYETLTCPELFSGWSLDLKKFFVWPKPTTVK